MKKWSDENEKLVGKFFTCGGLFFETLVGQFNEIGQTKEGGGSKTYFSLPSISYDRTIV